jgi:hypothetical protein
MQSVLRADSPVLPMTGVGGFSEKTW